MAFTLHPDENWLQVHPRHSAVMQSMIAHLNRSYQLVEDINNGAISVDDATNRVLRYIKEHSELRQATIDAQIDGKEAMRAMYGDKATEKALESQWAAFDEGKTKIHADFRSRYAEFSENEESLRKACQDERLAVNALRLHYPLVNEMCLLSRTCDAFDWYPSGGRDFSKGASARHGLSAFIDGREKGDWYWESVLFHHKEEGLRSYLQTTLDRNKARWHVTDTPVDGERTVYESMNNADAASKLVDVQCLYSRREVNRGGIPIHSSLPYPVMRDVFKPETKIAEINQEVCTGEGCGLCKAVNATELSAVSV